MDKLAKMEPPSIKTLWDYLRQYRDRVYELPDIDATKEVLEGFYNTADDLAIRFAELQVKHEQPQSAQSQPTINVNNSQAVRIEKPKLKEVTHDGKIESFRTFWTIFKPRVIDNKALDEAEKSQHLIAAVTPTDASLLAGMTLEKMIERLNEKYKSKTAIESLIVNKTRAVHMHHARDIGGLEKVSETTERMYLLVKEAKESKRLEERLFSLIYTNLPASIHGGDQQRTGHVKDGREVEAGGDPTGST